MPFLSGERLPNYPDARGSVVGIDHTTTPGEILLAAYEGVAFSLVQSIGVLHAHSSGIDSDAPIILVGGGAKGKVWQKTISRLSGRELVIPKSDELVAYGAAAQAAGILNNEAAVDVATRWNVSDGQRLAASAVDTEAIERNQYIRKGAHELNSRGYFINPQSRV
jgi:xylulokinase